MSHKLNRVIAGSYEPYLIAETAYAHEGDYNYLRQQIQAVDASIIDALKVHLLLDIDGYMKPDHPDYELVGSWLFDREQWKELLTDAKLRGTDVVALTDDEASLQWIAANPQLVDAIEIHSTGLNDLNLLEQAVNLGKPVFLGVGGSTVDEIGLTLAALEQLPTVLMFGFQSYPTDYRKVNLKLIPKLAGIFGTIVGYADHTAFDDPYNELVTIMGYLSGAPIIEKHFVLEKGLPRSDYESAVSVDDLRCLKNKLELANQCLGEGKVGFSPEEQAYRRPGLMKKVPVARRLLSKGHKLQCEDLIFKRVGTEVHIGPVDSYTMLGMELIRDISANEIIDYSVLK